MTRLRLACCAVLALSCLVPAFAEDKPAEDKPIKALLITGGCCHDYKHQAAQLVAGSKKHANIAWTVLHDPRTGTEGEIDLYNDPDWAKPYDVVVHNECFANTKGPEYIRKITEAHKAGAHAVVIHCAMHTYRAAQIDDWREFLGVTSFRHEHQSVYPLTVTEEGTKHPTMVGFPADYKSPKDELYAIQKVWPNTVPLVTGKSERDGKGHPAFWVSKYGEARVFGTTFGHGNETWDDAVFIDTVSRGVIWAAGKLGEDGKAIAGYEPIAAEEGAAHDSAEKAPAAADAPALDPDCKLCAAKTAEAMSKLAAGESELPPSVRAALRNHHNLHTAPSP